MTWSAALRPGAVLSAWILFTPAVLAQEIIKDCAGCPRMIVVPGGTFTMGSPATELERRKHEGPQSDVRVARFAIGATEITRRDYAAFVTDTKRPSASGCFTYGFSSFNDAAVIDPAASWRNPGFRQTADHPVACVSWSDARDYAGWLTRKTGHTYRLPSEAEWEYAARAGSTSIFFWGTDENRGCSFANGADPSLLRALPSAREEAIEQGLKEGDTGARYLSCDDGSAFTATVGRYQPNAWGLHDMTGNVWEWVEDCWFESLPTGGDARTEGTCEFRRTRGGSWDDYPEELRSARRSRLSPELRRNDVGFRLVRVL